MNETDPPLPPPLPPAPPPAWANMPPPGSIYDTGLASTPLPPQIPMVMPPMDWPPSMQPPDNAMQQAFTHALRAEIRQLEKYFAKQTRRFRGFGMMTLLAAAAVPVVIAGNVETWVAAGLGAVAAITGSLQTLFGFQDSAGSAMSLASRLESELVRYETGTNPYNEPVMMRFNHFVDRVTSLREEGSASFSGVWRSATVPSAK